MAEEKTNETKGYEGSKNPKFTREEDNVKLAINTKEDFEILTELFVGNDLYEQAKALHDVKIMKIIDML